jgi:hypothetical protein
MKFLNSLFDPSRRERERVSFPNESRPWSRLMERRAYVRSCLEIFEIMTETCFNW